MVKYKMDKYGLKKKVKVKNKKKFVAKKTVKIGLACIRNEEQAITGWVKQMEYFCEEIHALVDPDTNDKTLEIIESLPYDITVSFQDKSLGDSDDGGLGPKQELSMHIAENNFVKKYIKVGEWFLTMAADERFHPHDYYRIHNEVEFAKLHNFDSLTHRRLLEPLNIDKGQLKYFANNYFYDPNAKKTGEIIESMFAVKWPDISRPMRFHRRTQHWAHNLKPHGGYGGTLYPCYSAFPLWHFHKLKYNEIMPTSERDGVSMFVANLLENNADMIPLVPITHQMSDWRDLAMLEFGRYGDVKYPAILSNISGVGVSNSRRINKKIHDVNNQQVKARKKWVGENLELLEKHSPAWNKSHPKQ